MNSISTHLRQIGGRGDLAHVVRSLVGDSAVYLLGSAALGLGSLILIPLYTRHLTPAEFGVVALVEIVLLTVMMAAQLGLGVAYMKWFADTDDAARPRLLGTVVVLGTVVSGFAGAALSRFVGSDVGAAWLGVATTGFAWALWPTVMMEAMQQLLLTHLRARRSAVAFSLSNIARLVGIVGAAIWLVAWRGQGIEGVFVGRAIGNLLGTVVLVLFCMDQVRLCWSWKVARPMVVYGLPLVWTSLSGGLLVDLAERYFLNAYLTLGEVGYYGAAAKVSNILQVAAIQPFAIAWGGLIFHIAKKPDAARIYSTISVSAFLVVMGIASSMVAFGPLLFLLFTSPDYTPGLAVFPLLLLAHALRTLEYLAALSFYLTKRTHMLAVIYSATLLFSVLGNYCLVPHLGVIGAAVVRVFALAGALLAMVLVGQRHYHVSTRPTLLLLSLLPWCAMTTLIHNTPVAWTFAALVRAGSLSAVVVAVTAILLWRVIAPRNALPDD